MSRTFLIAAVVVACAGAASLARAEDEAADHDEAKAPPPAARADDHHEAPPPVAHAPAEDHAAPGAADDGDDGAAEDGEDGAAAAAAAAHHGRSAEPKAPPEAVSDDLDVALGRQVEVGHRTTPATIISVGLQLTQLGKFEIGPGSFQAEFYLIFRCQAAPCEPGFDVANGRITSKEKTRDTPLEQEFRVKAELNGFADLARFPFDQHLLPIVLVDKKNPTGVVYELDRRHTRIDADIRLAGWQIAGWAAQVEHHKHSHGTQVSEFEFDVVIKRPRLSALLKTLLPVCFLVLVAFSTLLLKPKSAGTRLTAATAGLMAVVMFHLSATSSLPPLGYLTLLDKFMIATYLVFLVNIVASAMMMRLDEQKRNEWADFVYRVSAGAIPGVALLGWVLVFLRVL